MMTKNEIESIRNNIYSLNLLLQVGYIYIMVNQGWQDKVKIGYADDLEKRRKAFSGTGFPDPSHVYAAYAVSERLEDKDIHDLIDGLNPDLRYTNNKEFYVMTPEHAYSILERIAKVSGTMGLLKRNPLNDPWFNDGKNQMTNIPSVSSSSDTKKHKEYIRWTDLGIKNGDKLVCIHDGKEFTVVDVEKRLISDSNGNKTSLSAYAKKFVHHPTGTVCGTNHFTFNGKILSAIAHEKGLCKSDQKHV